MVVCLVICKLCGLKRQEACHYHLDMPIVASFIFRVNRLNVESTNICITPTLCWHNAGQLIQNKTQAHACLRICGVGCALPVASPPVLHPWQFSPSPFAWLFFVNEQVAFTLSRTLTCFLHPLTSPLSGCCTICFLSVTCRRTVVLSVKCLGLQAEATRYKVIVQEALEGSF